MIRITKNEIHMKFDTIPTVFSPTCIDKGTLAMLSVVEFSENDKVLDLGCGYGFVGIFAAKSIGAENVVMSDSNKKCVELAGKNARLNKIEGIKIVHSDGFAKIDDSEFTLILSNPPYHADFSVPKHFIEKGFNRLQVGGKMIMVTKRRDWYKNKLTAIFGGVKVHEIDGYFVFVAERRGTQYAKIKR